MTWAETISDVALLALAVYTARTMWPVIKEHWCEPAQERIDDASPPKRGMRLEE